MAVRADIVAALVKFFARKLDRKSIRIDEDLRQRFTRKSDWLSLAKSINNLTIIADSGLRISLDSMSRASNIQQIAKALVRGTAPKVLKSAPKSGRGPHTKKAVKKTAAKSPVPRKKASKTLQPRKKLRTRSDGFRTARLERPAPKQKKPTAKKATSYVAQPPLDIERASVSYTVWYGTNRKLRDSNNPAKGYSGERDNKNHMGTCDIFVPKSHKIGCTGSSLWERLKTGEDDRLQLKETAELSPDEFWADVSGYLKSLEIAERDALIFIHGFNVSFDEAAIRAAQIGVDLAIAGAMAFFSWPSKGKKKAYTSDEATIDASEPFIRQFLIDFAKRSGASKVHIIAHSMGNRGLLQAVDRIASAAAKGARIPFSQIILAAADVDADTFKNLCAAYSRVSKRTTMYVSSSDRAIEASKWLHDFSRAGLTPPVMIAKGIDTINVTNSDLTLLGHGYVAEARNVLQDMYSLISNGSPPSQRFGLRPEKTSTGETYWLIER